MTAAPMLSPVAQTAPQLYCQLIGAGLGADVAGLRRIRDACLLGVQQTSHLVRGSGKPFSCHVIGVASLVADVTADVDMIVAALLHAVYQPRVSVEAGGNDNNGVYRQAMAETVGVEVEAILHAYQAAGPLLPGAAMVSAAPGVDRSVRILQLADLLEDGLDGGPWWHGLPDDTGEERGSAGQRAQQLRACADLFMQAPALGAGALLTRYQAVLADWEQRSWPTGLRSGEYSSFKVAGAAPA